MRPFEVFWTQSAESDLEAIVAYIKMDSLERAKRVFLEIKDRCADLYFFPRRNRIVPELEQYGILKYREIIHKRWKIIYKIDNANVYVLSVVDSSRNLEELLFQRLIKNS